MTTATVTAKGQITIPKDIRQALDLQQGDMVTFILEGERAILIPARRRSIRELRGVFSSQRPHTSHEEIREATGQALGQERLEEK